MELILWRHADANIPDRDIADDLQRPLTGKGRKQAARMAQWLDHHLPDSTRVFVSPALRAIETADALGRKYTVCDELLPNASAGAHLALAQWPFRRHSVLLVGHQPSLGRLASLLLFGEERVLSVRKGAVWWIGQRDGEEPGQPILRSCMAPDFL